MYDFLYETLAIAGSMVAAVRSQRSADREQVGRVVREDVEGVGQRVVPEQRKRGGVLALLLGERLRLGDEDHPFLTCGTALISRSTRWAAAGFALVFMNTST